MVTSCKLKPDASSFNVYKMPVLTKSGVHSTGTYTAMKYRSIINNHIKCHEGSSSGTPSSEDDDDSDADVPGSSDEESGYVGVARGAKAFDKAEDLRQSSDGAGDTNQQELQTKTLTDIQESRAEECSESQGRGASQRKQGLNGLGLNIAPEDQPKEQQEHQNEHCHPRAGEDEEGIQGLQPEHRSS